MTSSTPVNRSDLAARSLLFHPGERLGWVFRDRSRFSREFAEPEPEPLSSPSWIDRAPEIAESRYNGRKNLAAILFWVGMLVSLGLGLYNALFAGGGFFQFFVTGFVVTVILSIAALIFARHGRKSVLSTAERKLNDLDRQDEQRRQDWLDRATEWAQAEQARVDQLPEWGAATMPPEARRLDIFGGSLWAWQAFLTVYGTSALAERPVIVMDLSREVVCEELARTAQAAGVPVDAQLLPDQMKTTTLLSDLSGSQIVDALIESMYDDDVAGGRSERAMDHRLLTSLTNYLGDSFTLARLSAGLRALLDQPDDSDHLSAKERNYITDELYSADYRRQSAERLQRIESYLQPLEQLGVQSVDRGVGYLTCMALASQANNVGTEFLTDLLVQWLTHRIVSDRTSVPDVIIAGADSIKLRHLERLSDACERRGIRITIMFRNLRGDAENFLGRGVAGFMRLGNATEAAHAADHIGREHKFVISQLTASLGGNETHTTGDTWGESVSEGVNVSTSVGWSSNWNRGKSVSYRDSLLFASDRSYNDSDGGGKSETVGEGRNSSNTRNWSATRSFAEGSNWSNAHTKQRVQEYAVEPTVLQTLPDHAMLLVQPQRGQQASVVSVEVDPAIVTLAGVAMEPLPATPEPVVDGASKISDPSDLGAEDPHALTAERSPGITLDDLNTDSKMAWPDPANQHRE